MSTAASAEPHYPHHILIVDDAMDMRLLIIDALEDMGFTKIKECSDGSEALNQIQTKNLT